MWRGGVGTHCIMHIHLVRVHQRLDGSGASLGQDVDAAIRLLNVSEHLHKSPAHDAGVPLRPVQQTEHLSTASSTTC